MTIYLDTTKPGSNAGIASAYLGLLTTWGNPDTSVDGQSTYIVTITVTSGGYYKLAGTVKYTVSKTDFTGNFTVDQDLGVGSFEITITIKDAEPSEP